MARSGSCILAIAASSSVFPSAWAASALSSRTRSRAAAFSSALNPLDAVSVALVRFARFRVVLVAVLVGAILCAPVRGLTRTILSLLPQWLATLGSKLARSWLLEVHELVPICRSFARSAADINLHDGRPAVTDDLNGVGRWWPARHRRWDQLSFQDDDPDPVRRPGIRCTVLANHLR